MYRKLVSVMYLANIFFGSLFSLFFPIVAMLALGWLCNERWGMDGWIYAPLVLFGAVIGIYSMLRYVMSASRSLEQIEKEHKEKDNNIKKKTERKTEGKD